MGTVEQAQSSRGTNIAPGGVNTKGNYAELMLSSPFDAHGLLLHVNAPGVTAKALFDISMGPPGSEQIFINNLHTDGVSANVATSFHFPINIPALTRIAARIQSSNAASFRLAGHLYSGGFADISPFGKITTYGANTSDSGGTPIDPGASAGMKGAWIEVVGSTTSPITKLIIAIGQDANGVRNDTSWLFDVGVGSSGNESILIQNIPLVYDDGHIHPKSIGPISISIPAATRIAVRAQCTNTDATDRLFDIVFYGIS